MEVSELEQELASKNDFSAHLTKLTELIADPKVDEHDKIKASLLYVYCFIALLWVLFFFILHLDKHDKIKANLLYEGVFNCFS